MDRGIVDLPGFQTTAVGWILFEKDQKKDGSQPDPGKSPKPKTEKPKPEREGDKGKRKEKSPRTEEAIISPL